MLTFSLRSSICGNPRVVPKVLGNVYNQETLFICGKVPENCEVGSQIAQCTVNVRSPTLQQNGRIRGV
jgi:hypothetical protein